MEPLLGLFVGRNDVLSIMCGIIVCKILDAAHLLIECGILRCAITVSVPVLTRWMRLLDLDISSLVKLNNSLIKKQ